MASMTHRERVLAALEHEPTDRVPMDFGGTTCSAIHRTAYDRLMDHLGLDRAAAVMEARLRTLAIPEEPVLRMFDIDTRYLGLGGYEGGVQREIDEDNFIDEFGTRWEKTGDGHYIFVDGPLYRKKPPDVHDLDTIEWPDADNPGFYRGLGERAEDLRKNTDCAVILNLPAGIVLEGMYMRGFADFLKDLHRNPEFACRLMDRYVDWWIKVAENAIDIVGRNADILFFGDDLAMQLGPLFSPQIYRDLIKPRHKRMFGTLKGHGTAKVLYHCCGSVYPFIGDLVEMGVDALNPVQVTAKNMDPADLKEAFGDRISFWGGIDTQKALPFGSSDDVRAETRRIIDILGKGGGYVLNSVHSLQPDVPPENIVAMFDEARLHSYRL